MKERVIVQTSQTIYALYAHKRLVNEVEDLSTIATIETTDDVHMKGVFKEGTVIHFELPLIYPNVRNGLS